MKKSLQSPKIVRCLKGWARNKQRTTLEPSATRLAVGRVRCHPPLCRGTLCGDPSKSDRLNVPVFRTNPCPLEDSIARRRLCSPDLSYPSSIDIESYRATSTILRRYLPIVVAIISVPHPKP